MPQFQMSEGNRAILYESAFRLELSPLDEIDDHKVCTVCPFGEGGFPGSEP